MFIIYTALFKIFLFSAFDGNTPVSQRQTDLCQDEEGWSVEHNDFTKYLKGCNLKEGQSHSMSPLVVVSYREKDFGSTGRCTC